MKIYILIIIFLTSLIGSYFSQRNDLIVFSEGGEEFYLRVDGKLKNKTPSNRVKVTHILTQKSRINISFENESLLPVNKTIRWSSYANAERTMLLKRKRKKYKLKNHSYKPIPKRTIYNTDNNQPSKPNKPKLNLQKGNGVMDLEGNFYNSVIVDGQEWMENNLKSTKFTNGELIPIKMTLSQWNEAGKNSLGAYCYYENNISNKNKYGNMYNWYVASDSRNVCPQGWHVPSSQEWKKLAEDLGGIDNAGKHVKSKKAGARHESTNFVSINNQEYWWCADQKINSENPFYGGIHAKISIYSNRLSISDYWKNSGFYIRCKKN